MKSRTRPSFWRAYAALDSRSRDAARRAYRLFMEDPAHPSLRFKKLGGYEHLWSVRIPSSTAPLVSAAEILSLGLGLERTTNSKSSLGNLMHYVNPAC